MNNEELAHRFVYNSNDSAKGSNFWFKNDNIFSYSSLMAIIDRSKKIILIDERISNYSNTSLKHRRHLLSALPSNFKIFEWNWKYGSYIHFKHNEVLYCIDKQSRARVVDYSNQISRAIDSCIDYYDLFPDRCSEDDIEMLNDLKKINIQELLSSSKDLIESNKQRLLALKAREDAEKQDRRQKHLNNFLGRTDVVFDPNYNSVYLKVSGDKVYTSNSIQVDLNDAIMLYKYYLSGKNIVGAKIGYYTVVKSSKESVTIGCTTISAVELNRVLSEYIKH